MRCPRCGNMNCMVISESYSHGTDYSAGKGCIGALLFGPIGLLCGACGGGRKIKNTHYWVCQQCGYKWRM
ncbi:hypothetical protein SAMN04487761_14025 [Lachnospiraceae bacterium C7]|nr:hypothetical protein SAMN04487761_14025 [Lachnospiraceae bacterium C7]